MAHTFQQTTFVTINEQIKKLILSVTRIYRSIAEINYFLVCVHWIDRTQYFAWLLGFICYFHLFHIFLSVDGTVKICFEHITVSVE